MEEFSPPDEFKNDASKTGPILKDMINGRSLISLVGLNNNTKMQEWYNLNNSNVQVVSNPEDVPKVARRISSFLA